MKWKRGEKNPHGFLGSSITKLFPIAIIKTSREGIFLELWSNLCRRPLNLLSAAESYISSALQKRILTRPMFTWWEHKHEAHTSAARRTLTHLSHSLLLFPRGLSVHAWLDIDSTQAGFVPRLVLSSLAESHKSHGHFHRRAQCVPVQTLCGAASMPPGLIGLARSGEIDTGSWQHRVPRWLGTKASLARGLAQCSLIAYKLRQKRLERLLLYIFNLTWMESLLK